MIDKVKLYKVIVLDEKKFSNKFKYENYIKESEIDFETGEVLKESYQVNQYKYKAQGITIRYSKNTNKLWYEGKIIDILENSNLVYNLDDVYSLKEDILERINNKIYEIIGVELDIRDFLVSYIEVCFNIFNVDVNRYIYLFNKTFKDKQDPRYKNYTIDNNLNEESSYYVKTKSSYEKNIKDSYTINFYNKLDQLNNIEQNKSYYRVINQEDKDLAKDVLRLEVQLSYKELIKTSRKFNSFLDIDFCFQIVKYKYRQFIAKNENIDFYSYKKAKFKISENKEIKLKDKNKVLRYLKDKYSFNKKFNKEQERKYIKILNKIGIHRTLIDTKYNIDYLENPISLLEKKIQNIKKQKNIAIYAKKDVL